MKEKLFKFAGCTRGPDGVLKLRAFNDRARIQKHHDWGNTDISLHELPIAMTKEAAAQFLFQKGLLPADLIPTVKKARTRTVTVRVPNRAIAELTGARVQVEPADDDKPLTAKEARKLRAEFNKRVRIAYEAN